MKKKMSNESIKIPEYIPKNKYVIFVKGPVVAIGDNASDLADILPYKFLIDRNLFDQLDVYFMGKKQILLIKIAE